MSKVLFPIEPEIDFQLICISSHHKDYRLCWEINRSLGMQLKKVDEYFLGTKENPGELFSQFEYSDATDHSDFYLITNRCIPEAGKAKPEDLFPTEDSLKLVPEMKQADYLLLIYGQMNEMDMKVLEEKLSALSMVQAAWKQDVEKLRSKYNLLR
jgi:hypothetical protein